MLKSTSLYDSSTMAAAKAEESRELACVFETHDDT